MLLAAGSNEDRYFAVGKRGGNDGTDLGSSNFEVRMFLKAMAENVILSFNVTWITCQF
jgi:hypothetical protein